MRKVLEGDLMEKEAEASFTRLDQAFYMPLTLGMLAAIGPAAIDMYLPAMPAIAQDLNAGAAETQYTFAAYLAAFGLAQLAFGPWSDLVGRKVPLCIGLSVFALASIGCALAPTVDWLIAARIFQGLGAAALMVLPRAIIRDLHTGTKAAQLIASVMLVIAISPMLAPLAGSALLLVGDWRLIFLVLCIVSAAGLLLAICVLPETHPPKNRVRDNSAGLRADCATLIRDLAFVGPTFVSGFGLGGFMIFVASASFVYTEQFGLSPTQFSLAFAINALGLFAAGQAAGSLTERWGVARVISWAASGFAVFTLLLLGAALAEVQTLTVVILGLLLGHVCLGLLTPTTMGMALDGHGRIAGLAASLGGTLQVLIGAVAVALAGTVFDATALPMIATIALCAVLTLIATLITCRHLKASAPTKSGAIDGAKPMQEESSL